MAKVILQNVSNTHRGQRGRDVSLVNNVSLDTHDREFTVLTGPPGCGKSTILRMIAGLEEISGGDIFIDDRRVKDVPPKDRDLAMVFQNDALYPAMSVYDNMAFGLRRRDFSKAEIKKRVQEAAAVLGLQETLALKPTGLGRAQRQRVAIGRAMVRQPRIWLFDEPLLHLDPVRRLELRTEITKLHQRLETTMIYVTRDPDEAMAMGNQLVVLNNGVVQQNGAPMALYYEPVNLFVAGFLGRPPINLIHGTLRMERDSLLFSEQEGGTIEVRLPISERPAAKEFAGKSVVLGIRSPDVQVAQSPKGQGSIPGTFAAIVEIVEATGAETNLYLSTGAHTLVCRTLSPFDQRDSGRRMHFIFNVQKAHLFDSALLRRIN